MLSISASMRPETVHTIVDTFFAGKKAQVKQRLRDSLELIVDDLFQELVAQVKDLLVPVRRTESPAASICKANNCNVSRSLDKNKPSIVSLDASHDQPQQELCLPGYFTSVPVVVAEDTSSINGLHPKPKPPPPALPKVYAIKSTSNHMGRSVAPKRPSPDNNAINLRVTAQQSTNSSGQGPSVRMKGQEMSENSSGPLKRPRLEAKVGGTDVVAKDTNSTARKFACPEPGCGKHFPSNRNLKLHLRGHAGLKPFSCAWPSCSYASQDRANTLRHIRQSHLAKISANPNEQDQIQLDPKAYLQVNDELLK